MKNFLTGNGFIIVPRVTTTERNALPAANGMIVYDTTLNAFYKYENGAWSSFAGGGGASWGGISGTLSSQTDLQSALNAKEDSANKTDTMSGNTASSTKYLSAKGVYDWAVATFTTASAVASQITTAISGYATQAWVTSQGYITNVVTALGFTPENVSNKSDSYTVSSSTTYATTKAVVDGLATKQNTLTNPVTGTGTTNEIAYFTGASTVGSLAVATYPNLTELSRVKGVTSGIQTQLDAKTFSVPFLVNAFDPLDATNYFFGGITNLLAPSTTNTNQDFVIGYACTIVGCVIQAHGNTTQGSSEDVALSLRNNTTNTTTSMGNFKTNATSTTTVVTAITGLNISVAASDLITLQMNGTWATNPTQVRLTGYLIIRL